MKGKEAEGDRLMKKAQKLMQPSLVSLRLKPDWDSACPLVEQAATVYKQAKVLGKARVAHERAAICQEKSGSAWHAARHLEAAGALATEMGDIEGTIDLYSHAAELYFEAGRPKAGSLALSNGAKALGDGNPEKASELYSRAIEIMCESDDRATGAPEIFRLAITHEIKQGGWESSVELLLKYGEFCEEKNLHTSQNRCYLGAVVLWLHAENGAQAWATFRDCISIASFSRCEEGRAAEQLIDAYRNNSTDKVREVIKANPCFQFLDAAVGRLAVKLPKGDLGKIASDMDSAAGAPQDLGDEDDDEDELI